MTRRRSASIVVLATATALTAACLEVNAPPGGIAAITLVLPPSPSVVIGDVSRDSTGAQAPLRVFAFDEHGDTIEGVDVQFIALARGLTIDSSGVARGDSVVPTGVQVVGTVGALQTTPLSIPVTVAPARVRQEPTAQLAFDVVADTLAAANRRELTLTVSGNASPLGTATDTFAVGFIVDYAVVASPAGTDGRATAVLTDGSKETSRDTTAANGQASRTLQLRPVLFTDPSLSGGERVDTVRVQATVRHLGGPAAGTPVTFLIPICLAGSPAC